jgi:FkbM family methyltransferase
MKPQTGLRSPRARALQHRLTGPARRAHLPVLRGSGRGLRVRVGDSVIKVTGRGEPKVERAFLELIAPGDVVYDVGANVGWYSLLAARRVGPGGAVVAFEPLLENAYIAQQNASANSMANMSVVGAAVADVDGWFSFLREGSLMGRLERSDRTRPVRSGPSGESEWPRTLVPVLALDSWIHATGQRPPSVVKIDVEGSEARVLRGMRGTLETFRPVLIIELHGTKLEVADLLDEAGYEHRAIEVDAATRDAPWWAHVLARPSG